MYARDDVSGFLAFGVAGGHDHNSPYFRVFYIFGVRYTDFMRNRVVVCRIANKIESAVRRLSDGTMATRLVVCALAALILFVRVPAQFVAPQFWAEDSLLISAAYNQGWAALMLPIGGTYYNLYGALVAAIAILAPPIAWPWISIYGAHLAAVAVVFLVTSPRFEFPYRAVAALAVVAVPVSDVFGGLANAQWCLAIALFVLPLLRTGSSWMLPLEAIVALVLGLEGPLAAFVLPIYAWRIWTCAEDRPRLIVLAAITAWCAAIQILAVARVDVFNLIEPAPYDHIVWLTMPIRWLDSLRLANIFIHHEIVMVSMVIGGAAVTVWFAFKQPYRMFKLSMLMFAGIVLYSGMYKYRNAIVFLSNDRYVYPGAVFAFWFACVAIAPMGSRRAKIVVPLLVLLIIHNPIRRFNQFEPKASVAWTDEVARIGHGPIAIPVAPSDFWAVRLER